MKKLKYFLLTLFLSQTLVFANFNDILVVDIQYDWINKNLVEKEAIISEIHDIIFENGEIQKKDELRKENKDFIKDKNYKKNYLAASAGYKEFNGNNISAFYYKNQKHIYMYALQDKKNISKIYYYDALGKLRYLDVITGEYPDYPYSAIQYNANGKPISAIYYVSKDAQYLFNPDGSFKGLWYKHNLYDKHSKVILKRTQY